FAARASTCACGLDARGHCSAGSRARARDQRGRESEVSKTSGSFPFYWSGSVVGNPALLKSPPTRLGSAAQRFQGLRLSAFAGINRLNDASGRIASPDLENHVWPGLCRVRVLKRIRPSTFPWFVFPSGRRKECA